MDRDAVAKECLRIERSGGSVYAYLRSLGCISPWGTWYRLQRENLGRKGSQIRRDEGKVYFTDKKEMLDAVVQELRAGRDPFVILTGRGYKSPGKTYLQAREYAQENEPELFKEFPKNLRSWKLKNGLIKVKKKTAVKVTKKPVKKAETNDGELSYEEIYNMEVPYSMEVPEPIITTEPEKITKPLMYDGFTVTAVHGQMGRYNYSESCGREYIDFETETGDELSLTVQGWREFLAELQHAAQVLGVDLSV